MTCVRMACVSGRMAPSLTSEPLAERDHPALLVSYAFWSIFRREREKHPAFDACYRDFSLDSGAFSAANSGKTIDLGQYIEFTQELQRSDSKCVEIFALDVIGDWRASARNAEIMWKAGVRVIPTFHVGEPTSALKEMAATYPKVAVGGAVRWTAKRKIAWLEDCFAHIWPKKIHGLGMTGETILARFPFHSVDASDWEFMPSSFGEWKTLGKVKGLRGGAINLRMEVEWHLRLERQLRDRWRREMAILETL